MVTNKLFFESDITESQVSYLYDEIEKEVESGEVGYYSLPDDIDHTAKKIKDFCQEFDFKKKEIKNIVVIGIGGSSLGTRAVEWMLYHKDHRADTNFVFLENVDPNEIERKTRNLKFYETFFIVISKSGSTIETTSITKYIAHKFDVKLNSWSFQDHFAIVTDEGSPLDQFAKDNKLIAFHIPHNVGGRFSVMSAVGLLPLCIAGYDIYALLDGAKELKKSFFARKEDQLIKKAYHYATSSESLPINVLFSYSSSFRDFNDWYVQLWGESLGKINKSGKKVGLTPVGLVGSIDQHSFLQLIIEGPKNKTVTMIKVKDFQNNTVIPDITIPNLEKTNFINGKKFQELINAQCDATMQSILDQDVDVDLIEIDQLDEHHVGYLFFYYELLTSLVGKMLNVNTYDQPGVEYGKKILKETFED